MSNELAQAGVFRGQITEYGLIEAESGAVAVAITVQIDDIFHEGEWHDWREHEFVTTGQMWVIKKDGKLNKSQCEALIQHAGWDGDLTSIAQRVWHPSDIQVKVEADTYKDQTRFRIAFINGYDSPPGASTISEAKAKQLQQKLGGELRAMVGNKSRNEAPPANGVPAKPNPGTASAKSAPESQVLTAADVGTIPAAVLAQRRKKAATAAPATAEAGKQPPDDSIPF